MAAWCKSRSSIEGAGSAAISSPTLLFTTCELLSAGLLPSNCTYFAYTATKL